MFYLIALITNDKEQHAQTVNPFENMETAKVNYHQKLANFHNASDVLYAVVEILDEYGRVLQGFSEIVDHRPEPEAATEE